MSNCSFSLEKGEAKKLKSMYQLFNINQFLEKNTVIMTWVFLYGGDDNKQPNKTLYYYTITCIQHIKQTCRCI